VNTQFTIVDLTSGIIQLKHYENGLGLDTHRYIGGKIPKVTNYHTLLVDFEI
jgi:hypothetical protein